MEINRKRRVIGLNVQQSRIQDRKKHLVDGILCFIISGCDFLIFHVVGFFHLIKIKEQKPTKRKIKKSQQKMTKSKVNIPFPK